MISLIIPVYKNTALFLENLKHNLRYVKNAEIIIVNDDPETDLTLPLKEICPQATLINNSKNLGFGPSVNLGVKKARADYLLFLNSDVLLMDKRFEKALTEFANPKLFGLSFAQLNNQGELSVANAGEFKNGLFQHRPKPANSTVPTLWADGGSCLLRRAYFNELGGFDSRFAPFYWEDVDLGFRAAKRGYQILYYPKVVVKHNHATTINKYYPSEYTRTINYRNQLLFTWKNGQGKNLIRHFCLLPLITLRLRKDKSFAKGLLMALKISLFGHA